MPDSLTCRFYPSSMYSVALLGLLEYSIMWDELPVVTDCGPSCFQSIGTSQRPLGNSAARVAVGWVGGDEGTSVRNPLHR